MKKFFILLMVVLMLAGLTSTSFAAQNGNKGASTDGSNGNDGVCPEVCVPVCSVCPNPDCPDPDCVPDYDGDGLKHRKGKQ